jgi:putative component of membrane protein insertase Oxa1/YidC/SpoIIIJ protein YidD
VRGSSTPLLEQRLLSFGGESAGRLTRYQDLTAPRSGVETRFAMRCSHYLICRTGHLSMICVLKPVALGLSGCHWLRPGGNDARRYLLDPASWSLSHIGIMSMEAGVKLMYK